jgi:hypothetical protein
MEKINLPFFYQMGAQINPLTKFTPDQNNRALIWLASFSAHSYVYGLLSSYASLTVCRTCGIELINAIMQMQKWMNETPGVKFNDADLLGIPLRVTISPRTLEKNSAEVKWRREKKPEILPFDGIVPLLKDRIAQQTKQ